MIHIEMEIFHSHVKLPGCFQPINPSLRQRAPRRFPQPCPLGRDLERPVLFLGLGLASSHCFLNFSDGGGITYIYIYTYIHITYVYYIYIYHIGDQYLIEKIPKKTCIHIGVPIMNIQ